MNKGALCRWIQVRLNVCIHDIVVALVACYSDRFQRLGRASLRAESITATLKIRFENRLDHQLRRHLHHSVSHRRYPQRPLLPICFRYVSPLHRRRAISSCPQRRLDLRQNLSHASLFDGLDRLRIDSRRAAIAAHSPPCFPQDVTSVDPVVQRMEASSLTPLGTHIYSLRWSSRTFSLGVLAIAGMPSHLPPPKHDQSRAPSLQRVVLHAFFGTTDPSDSLPAPLAFSCPALYVRSRPDSAAR